MEQIDCPKCSQAMERWESKGVCLDHCSSCKGLWFDEGELTRHFANTGNEISEGDLKAAGGTSLRCPRCKSNSLLMARLASVEVDICEQCRGIFLDFGEVHELLGAINKTSLEKKSGVAGFDSFALGLYIGSQLGVSRGAGRRR